MAKVKDLEGKDVDIDELVQNIISKQGKGDPNEALSIVLQDNKRLREKNATLRTENESLKQGTPEGGVVLTKDEVAAYEAYKALGKPDELKATVEKKTQLEAQVADIQRNETIRGAAEAYGWKPTVLKDLATARGLNIELVDVETTDQAGNKTVKKAAAVVQPDGKKKPLDELVTESLGDYLPSLKAEADQGRQTGTQWVPQQSGGKPADTNTAKVAQGVINNYKTAASK